MADQVEKVSSIYINGIGFKRAKDETGTPVADGLTAPVSSSLTPNQLRTLSDRFKPPSSPKQALSRPVHPDMVVLIFSLVIPVFLYGIFTSQQVLFLPTILFLGIVYALYAWKRKQIIAKFQRNIAEREAAENKTKQGIERWMRLYYCARDDGVFDLSMHELIPADFLPGYLTGE